MSTHKIGDLVLLKSGSPLMTVEEIRDDNVTCVFLAHEQGVGHFGPYSGWRISRNTFKADTLAQQPVKKGRRARRAT
jgi:uncharacterized protein YodC (DUF2158 family)